MLAKVKKLVGINFKHMGRLDTLPETKAEIQKINENGGGLDCLGLLILVYDRVLGYDIPDYAVVKYEKKWYKKDRDTYLRGFAKFFEKVDVLQMWDAIMFRTRGGDHAGIYLEDDRFIHCLEESAVVISRLNGPWERMSYGFYRPK
jgi:cell wall-associated NlpC family hydrolase